MSGAAQYYRVYIFSFHDPSGPTDEKLKSLDDIILEKRRLIQILSEKSECEIRQQVHAEVMLLLCDRCYELWIEDPFTIQFCYRRQRLVSRNLVEPISI